MSESDELSPLTKLKCRMVGHDWYYYRDRGERRCHRCDHLEEYSVDETHTDEGAEKRARRYRIRNGNLYVEVYTVTAAGPNTEHWQWFPVASGPADDAHLLQLKREIEQHMESTDPDESNEPEDNGDSI